ARAGVPAAMHEELMKKKGVLPRDLPTLEILHDGEVRATLRPHGLWIIGANGRVDLKIGSQLYFVVDRAKTFDVPSWYVSPATDRQNLVPFDDDWIKAHVSA